MRILVCMMVVGLVAGVAGCGRAPDGGGTSAPATSATMASAGAATQTAGALPDIVTTSPVGPKARIVSLVPAATEILRQIGALDCVVGVTRYDIPALPAAYQNLPAVGDYESINYERIAGLHPTAIVVQMAADRVPERLKELCAAGHADLINLKMERLSDLEVAVRALSAAAGAGMDGPARAQAIGMAATRPAERMRTRVVCLASDVVMMAVGRDNFLDDEITAAGGENVAAACGTGYPIINREKLIALAPDVLLIAAPSEPEQQGQNDPRLQKWNTLPIPAAVNHRIYLLTDPAVEQLTLGVEQNIALLHQYLVTDAPLMLPETRP